MLGDPIQVVTCDNCGYEEHFDMTLLVWQAWDNRDLAAKLAKAGWFTCGREKHYCPDCTEDGWCVES